MVPFSRPHAHHAPFHVGVRLDDELARGLDPQGAPERESRARWITTPAQCERLAGDFERLVADAERPSQAIGAGVPFRKDAVAGAHRELVALAAALRSARHPSAAAVARARTLLTDVASPVYGDTGEDLRDITQDISRMLEEPAD